MMLPRLFLARQMLADDGVLAVSIDDIEARHLRMLLDEQFGQENFIGQVVWEKGRKNDAKLLSVGHEYLILYARNLQHLKDEKTVWREEKPGAKVIWAKYLELREQYGKDDAAISDALAAWFKELPKRDPAKKLARYKRVDQYGPWRDRDISWPGGDGPRYDVIHPQTGKPCAVPERGWGFATKKEMERQIDLGLVEFRDDHTEPPMRKAHLRPVPEELAEDDETAEFDEDDTDDEELATQVMPSVIYKQSQVAVKYLRKLMDGKLFDNPKDHEVLSRLVSYVVPAEDSAIVLDFFAGSGSVGEAVMRSNEADGGDRRFVLVQLPEDTRRKMKDGTFKESPASKAGYKTIADLCRERLRRAMKAVEGAPGFRAFALGLSHLRPWTPPADRTGDALNAQLSLLDDPLRDGWTEEGVLWEVALREGLALDSAVTVEPIEENRVYRLHDAGRDQTLRVCLDDAVDLAAADALGLTREDLFVCRDAALDDATAANLALQCRLKTI